MLSYFDESLPPITRLPSPRGASLRPIAFQINLFPKMACFKKHQESKKVVKELQKAPRKGALLFACWIYPNIKSAQHNIEPEPFLQYSRTTKNMPKLSSQHKSTPKEQHSSQVEHSMKEKAKQAKNLFSNSVPGVLSKQKVAGRERQLGRAQRQGWFSGISRIWVDLPIILPNLIIQLLVAPNLIKLQVAMLNDPSQDMQRNSAFRKLEAPETDLGTSDPSRLGVTAEMMQVINAQNILIMKLLERQTLLYQQLNKKFSSSDSGSGSTHKQNNGTKVSGYREFNNLEQFSSSSNQEAEPKSSKNNVRIIQKPTTALAFQKPLKNVEFKGEINSSPEEGPDNSNLKSDKNSEKRKQTETKNMVKNFAKAIFGYIRKNRDKRLNVLTRLGISEEEFMRAYEQFKGRIHSISELRSLWTAEGTAFNKAFRVLSCQYLRKHCLERTFNSRVENYSVHLKYRQRLMDGLADPEHFTVLKID